jgi:hypothetical protein
MTRLFDLAILAAVVVGSVGFVGGGLYYERYGREHVALRWMRNAGVVLVWPLLVLRVVL